MVKNRVNRSTTHLVYDTRKEQGESIKGCIAARPSDAAPPWGVNTTCRHNTTLGRFNIAVFVNGKPLTANPSLPVFEPLPNVSLLESLSACTKLIVTLQSLDDKGSLMNPSGSIPLSTTNGQIPRTFCFAQEFRGIGKVLNNPKRCNTGEDRC